MQETRRARLAALMQEELSLLVRELKDPRIPALTFTRIELTEDAGQATVYVALFGEPTAALSNERSPEEEKAAQKRTQECLAGLESASGFLRKQLGRILTVRHVPYLVFREDRGFMNASRVHELLQKISSSGN